MTAEDLRAWQQRMGYTQQQAAAALGMSWATYKRWLVGDPSRLIALACAAIEAGIAPLGAPN
ncbi:MAG TPA: helix-turn-helix transcriptional regulator [Burkholderiaceae bacterium]